MAIDFVCKPTMNILKSSLFNLPVEVGNIRQNAPQKLTVENIAHRVGLEFAEVLRPVNILKAPLHIVCRTNSQGFLIFVRPDLGELIEGKPALKQIPLDLISDNRMQVVGQLSFYDWSAVVRLREGFTFITARKKLFLSTLRSSGKRSCTNG